MSNIFIKNAYTSIVEIFTFEDSTSVQHNASVPILQDGTPIFVTAAPAVVHVVNSGVSIHGGHVSIAGGRLRAVDYVSVVAAVSLGGSTAHIGRVSVFNDATPTTTSVRNPVSIAGVVSAHQDGTWVTQVSNQVSIAPQTLIVHVCNTAPGGASGGSPQVSVGGAVSVQATQIAGVDQNGNARTPLLDTSGVQKVAGFTLTPEYSFTRPTDIAPYTTGDLVANSTVAGTVVPMSWEVSRFAGGGGSLQIRKVRLMTPADNRSTDRSYRVHFFNIATGLSVGNGDNGVFAPTQVSSYAGYIDVPMHLSAATGAAGIGFGEVNIVLGASQVSISGLIEARVSILPASGVEYRTFLEILSD